MEAGQNGQAHIRKVGMKQTELATAPKQCRTSQHSFPHHTIETAKHVVFFVIAIATNEAETVFSRAPFQEDSGPSLPTALTGAARTSQNLRRA